MKKRYRGEEQGEREEVKDEMDDGKIPILNPRPTLVSPTSTSR
jgi:hypothetical protein